MASNKVPLKGYMDGIDISAWQDTIDITKVPCDFVIVKATEGTDYKNDESGKTPGGIPLCKWWRSPQ